MRRLILTVLGVGAMVALPASLASATDHVAHPALPGCGPVKKGPTPSHKYPCTKPTISLHIDPTCQAPGKYAVSPIRITANGGIHKVIIKLDGKTVKTYTYDRGGNVPSLRGPRRKTYRHVILKSAKLDKAGHFRLGITVLDWTGKMAHKTYIISICKPPPPPFTG